MTTTAFPAEQDLKKMSARFQPSDIKADVSKLSPGDREALATVERMFEHLKANEVNIDSDKLTLGPVLKMNGKAETFIGNADADKMLTRDYRKPYVVPAITI